MEPAGQGIKTNFLSDDFFFFSLFVPGVPYSVPGFLLYVQYLAGCRESNPSCCDRSQVCYHWATHIPLNLLIKIYVVNYNCGTIQYIYCTIYSVISCRCIPLLVSCYSPVYCTVSSWILDLLCLDIALDSINFFFLSDLCSRYEMRVNNKSTSICIY